ncbi:MAG: ribonuclease Y, partial [Syntrophobacterales bacterium]|nr:ribonuclease Y [Syntrophobacterales bacterium]
MLILMIFGSIAIGVVIGYLFQARVARKRLDSSENLADRIIDEAKKEAETIKKEAVLQVKENLFRANAELEKETKEKRAGLEKAEKKLHAKEEEFEKKAEQLTLQDTKLTSREKSLAGKEAQLAAKTEELTNLISEETETLKKIAGLSPEEAKRQLIQSMESEAKQDAATIVRRIEEEAKHSAEKKSREIIAYAVQRYASDLVSENTVSVVNLPNDEMKGRIIGREGRNIRAIEAATGVDLIVDDTPEAVVLSSFDPIRREVARLSLERLVVDGRIHPGRIEEIVKKAQTEVDTIIRETGERISFDVGVHEIHPEIIYLLGSLKYRTSYSQNVLQHSVDVAYLTGMMAAELKMNVKEAKRAGLLHDIGKAIDHKIEGPHASIGADYAKRFGESPRIVQAIATHHDDGQNNTLLGVLVQAADTLSAARPGARREMLESYVKRLEELENIAKSFNGVDKCFAIQAGREVRILVENEKISDN